MKGRDTLANGLIIGIGNGESTSLWYHHWVGNGPLYKLMDRDVPDSKAHWFVSHIIRNHRWYLEDIRHLITDDICNLILATPLSSQNQEDFIRWKFSNNGNFTIKSAYFSICEPSWYPNPDSLSWKNLWKVRCPFKYKMLL